MNMMFPKPTKQKKRKKHKKSIMQPKGDRRCYLCMLLDGDFTYKPYLEEHHVLFGNTHAFAEAEGLKVNLCLEHHRNGPAAVHNNAKNARILMAKAQEVYERTHTREEWMQIRADRMAISLIRIRSVNTPDLQTRREGRYGRTTLLNTIMAIIMLL